MTFGNKIGPNISNKYLMIRLDSQQVADMFMIFNVSGDGSMSRQEFKFCYENWILKGLQPVLQLNSILFIFRSCNLGVR